MKIFSFLISFIMMFTSCNSTKEIATNLAENNTDFKVLHFSEYGGTGEDEFKVINSSEEFVNELSDSFVGNPEFLSNLLASIDFTKKMIVIKNFRSQNNGGTTYQVQSVQKIRNIIEVKLLISPPNGLSIMAITKPILIMEMDKVEKPEINFINN